MISYFPTLTLIQTLNLTHPAPRILHLHEMLLKMLNTRTRHFSHKLLQTFTAMVIITVGVASLKAL